MTREVAGVRIKAKLVVLSCCHSAQGKILAAEGVVGIARAFLVSGCPFCSNVIVGCRR